MAKITWLASYPKSGNTWTRVFLTNYLRNAAEPADINEMDETPIASARHFFDDVLGVESGDLLPEELDHLRPAVYRRLAQPLDAQPAENRFFKVHDAYTLLPNGQPLFPTDVTAGVIYILRSPLDVAVSYANHSNISVERAVRCMADPTHTLAPPHSGMAKQVHQRLLTWSEHVTSWLNVTAFPVHLVRYEDMVADPVASFTGVVRFIGGDLDAERIERAVRFSAFDVVQKQEQERGFREKMPLSQVFFRKGKVGTWREKMSDELTAQIIRDHRAVMLKHGYLTEEDEIVY